MSIKQTLLDSLKHGLIVSCQAQPGDPFFGAEYMARMAIAAQMGGAVGIRANGPDDISAIKKSVTIPIFGIEKKSYDGFEPYITPTLREVERVIKAGADIIAIDATERYKPGMYTTEAILTEIRKQYPDILVMGDVSTIEEGIKAEKIGFDLIATTLVGYTKATEDQRDHHIDLNFIKRLTDAIQVPVIAEGRIWTPEEAVQALSLGAFAVVVGTAITRPQEITRRFTKHIKGYQEVLNVSKK
ncbi:MAG: N-acetylmannosamine-6-phosphate 2-epimerase [Candidatus Carbobacillus altaicus]|uniref:Putative N-acetylmannosamine-6-phosphate 2-epimerase n=1 Tax=Candidatus Carbonibacillus altaicus TaxID=2163959 RepID=A0A2R6Y402_9BACL|nr:MAG: N-acetylmannosamine-6-phosphate 2-epimerase [Candidatus Carbobacillus altaicus]